MRVMLIDDDSARRDSIETSLREHGHEVVLSTIGTPNLVKVINRHKPDVILIDVESPSRDTLESLRQASNERPRPIVIFSGQSEPETIRRSLRAGVTSYIVDGLSPTRIQPILDVAIARFEQHQLLKLELDQTRNLLANDRDMQKALGLIMKRRNISERKANEMLNQMANDQKISLVDAARMILKVADLI
jgi:response regulator NasT